jgi:hypothetical protein
MKRNSTNTQNTFFFILVDNQLDAEFFYNTFIYLNSLHVSSKYVLLQVKMELVQPVSSRPAYLTASNTERLHHKLYSYSCPPEDENIDARNM